MLPGFRLLLASVMLSASVLIFGLGAAALLRAAHEEFVTVPSWREAQKPVMQLPAPQFSITTPKSDSLPRLAMVRIEPLVSTPNDIALPDPPSPINLVTEPEPKTDTPAPVALTTQAIVVQASTVDVKPTVQTRRLKQRRALRARMAAIRRQQLIQRSRARAAQIEQYNADPFRLFWSPPANGS